MLGGVVSEEARESNAPRVARRPAMHAWRCTRGMCVVESCDCVPVRVGGGSSALVWLCKHTKGGRVMESKWGAVLVHDASAAAREGAHEVSPASGLPQDGCSRRAKGGYDHSNQPRSLSFRRRGSREPPAAFLA